MSTRSQSKEIIVGLIANPASGQDIRRLTAKASVFPTAEKANMVQRILGPLGLLAVDRALMMPDATEGPFVLDVRATLDAAVASGALASRAETLTRP